MSRYNWHKINSTFFKCTIRCFNICIPVMLLLSYDEKHIIWYVETSYDVLTYVYLWWLLLGKCPYQSLQNCPHVPLYFFPLALFCPASPRQISVVVSVIIFKFAFLRTWYKCSCSTCVLFCLNSFIQHDYFETHPCSMYPSSFRFISEWYSIT